MKVSMPLLPPFKTSIQLRDGATEALFVISFGPFCCPKAHHQLHLASFEQLCDAHNIDLVNVSIPSVHCLPSTSQATWQQHKLMLGHLIVKELGALKEWARVCIVDERFQWAPVQSPFTQVPSESIGVAFGGKDPKTNPALMVVLSEAHYGSFRGALEELSDGSLWLRMQVMEAGQDRFLQYLMQQAQVQNVPVVSITVDLPRHCAC